MNIITTNLKISTLKKLIFDSCTQTPFSFNGKIYKQNDSVSMGPYLDPVFANIILTEFEKLIVSKLIQSCVFKFYKWYVDDTLVLVKLKDIQLVLDQFNSFHPNLKFTFDDFANENVHFLDLAILKDGITIYRKDTDTAQYTHFSSFEPWTRKTTWISSVFFRAARICSTKHLLKDHIKKKFHLLCHGSVSPTTFVILF